MVGLELDCHPEPVAPSGERLPRDAVDEVDAHVVEAGGACRRERLARLARSVPAGEVFEVLVTQRLDAQADPRHAGLAEALPVGPLPLARIRLDGDFLDHHALPSVPGRPDHARGLLAGQKGRGAATEVDRFELARRGPSDHLLQQRIDVAGYVGRPAADRHEVAVGAHQPTKRHVHVQVVRRRRCFHCHQIASTR